MGVQTSATNLVATRLGDDGLAEASEQRTDEQHRAAQRGTLAYKRVALQIVQVQVLGAERVVVGRILLHVHPHVLQQADEVVHVQNVGHVLDVYLIVGEQTGTDHLQGLILGALWCDGSFEQLASFYDE